MRDIIFRGKRKDNGEWVEGYYYHEKIMVDDTKNHDYIIGRTDGVYFKHWCIPETVGQYTGLTDKNGKRVFEGDIVKHFDNSDENYDIGKIYYDTKLLMWRRTTQGSFHKTLINSYKLSSDCIYEVIGNIHDNPELLKGGG